MSCQRLRSVGLDINGCPGQSIHKIVLKWGVRNSPFKYHPRVRRDIHLSPSLSPCLFLYLSLTSSLTHSHTYLLLLFVIVAVTSHTQIFMGSYSRNTQQICLLIQKRATFLFLRQRYKIHVSDIFVNVSISLWDHS